MHLCTTTCPALIVAGASPAHPHPGAAPAGTRRQATTPAEDTYIESERAYNLRSKKLFGLIDTTAIGNGRAAWASLQGLTNINDDSKWSSLRLSDVSIDERTIAKIVSKINQISLERESIR
eukprot:3160108-Pleurochrysis_carterae.AAC.1